MQPISELGGDALAGHHGHRRADAALQQAAQQGEAIHDRHLQVGQDRVDPLLGQQLEGARTMLRRGHREDAGSVQGSGQGQTNELVVLDEQQGNGGQGARLSSRA